MLADGDPGPGGDAPELFDFLEELFQDLEEGGAHPLEHYLVRFPGHEEAIRREYAAHLTGAPAAEDPRAAAADGEGRVGPYRLLGEIGRGGQGVVHLAEDTRIARRVALKVLPRAALLLSQDSRSRLRREAEVISSLDHPGLCGIYDAVIEDELAYIAMPFIEGRTLASAIAEAREGRGGQELPLAPRREAELRQLLELFEEAARALHAAHEAGIVHRDVKPANLMITPDGRPVWLDFGQARQTEGDGAALTLSGEVFGTPAYMSPEQVAGEVLDRRTDIWSLGVTLFEALTLQRPFEASTAHGLLAEIRDGEPRRARELNRAVGRELAVVLETALERDLSRRYKSALDLAEDLARLRRREPIAARPASRALRLRRWVQRYPVLFALICVVTASLVTVSWLLREQVRAVADKDAALLEAEQQLEAALGRHKAQRAGALLSEDPASALILAVEGVELAPNALTREALFAALEGCWLRAVYEAGDRRRFLDLALVPGRGAVAAVRFDGTAALHELESGRLIEQWEPHAPEEGRAAGRCVAASADGRRVATGGSDGRVVVRDLLGAEPDQVLVGPGGAVLDLAFGPVGDRLAVRTEDSLAIHDLREARTLATHRGLPPPGAPLETVASPGAFLESPRRGPGLRAWRASDGARIEPGAASPGEVLWSGLGPAGRLDLLAGGEVVRASASGARAPALAPGEELLLARLAPGGLRLFVAAVGAGRTVQRVVDLDEGRVLPLRGAPGRAPQQAAFSPDGRRLAVIDGDKVLRLWDAATGELLGEGRGYVEPHELEWSADGQWVLTHQAIGPQARLWYGRPRPDTFLLRAGSAPLRRVAFTSDGSRALTLDEAGRLVVWTTDPGAGPVAEPWLVLEPERRRLMEASFDPRGELLLACGEGVLEVWDLATRERLVRRTGGEGLADARWTTGGEVFLPGGPARLEPRAPESLRRSGAEPAGRVVPLPSGEGWLELEPAGAGVALRSFDGGAVRWRTELGGDAGPAAELVVEAAFSPGGGEVALARGDRWIDFLDLASGSATREPLGVFPPAGLDWSADGRRLVIWGSSGRGAFRVEDLEPAAGASGAMRAEEFHAEDLTDAGFDPTGELALSASLDGTLLVRRVAHLEDPRSTRLVARLRGPGPAVTCAVIGSGPGGPRVLAGLADGTARVWPVDPLPAALARRPRAVLRDWELARERRQAEAVRLEYR